MKKYEIEYIASLGSYLDENNIEWGNLGGNRITITCHDINDLFRIAYKFGLFVSEIEQD